MQNEKQFYMEIARAVSTASRAERNKVGAILVKDGNVISFGYNGTPRGFDNACERFGETVPEVLHAESNAIVKCAQSTQSSAGATLYVTVAPCFDCAKLIIQAGIVAVIWENPYRLNTGLELLESAGIMTKQL